MPVSRAAIAASLARRALKPLVFAGVSIALSSARVAAPARSLLPPIAFVSRTPVPGDARAIPGLGPAGRTIAPGGRLMIRESGGSVRALLPAGRFFDVSDPCASPDGGTIAFAALEAPGAPGEIRPGGHARWRLWSVRLNGTALSPVTTPLAAPDGDDFDPCWISDDEIVFASTRFPQRGEYDDGPVSNLYLCDLPSRKLIRLTSERNGAEEPSFDPARRRLLFARWWFNRHGPSGLSSPGAHSAVDARTRPSAADTVNLWLAMEMAPHGGIARLAAGDPRARRGGMGYQPVALADGRVLGVAAANTGLLPGPGACAIQRLEPRGGRGARLASGVRVAGAGFDAEEIRAYGGTRGLAAPSACAPAPLADGRIVFALDPGARGDFGLWIARADGGGVAPLVDLPGTLELDPAPAAAWPHAWRARALEARLAFLARGVSRPGALPGTDAPATRLEEAPPRTFRYFDRDVFSGAGAPRRTEGARLRFFATLSRPERAGGDTAVLVREVPVPRGGRVDVSLLPAHTPMFEDLVGADGVVLRGARGPAHVAGLNVAPGGAVVRCAGCHVGHSTAVRSPLGR